jgi:nucleotide-binding universal stress UspA family protein
MKKILVPTDFSFNAEKALEYALHLGMYFSSEVILFHTWNLPHQKSTMFVSTQELIRKKAEEDLHLLKEKIQDRFPDLKLKTAMIMGNAGDSIKSAAKNMSADIIIMGTKGASGMGKYLFGSVTTEVIEDAPCPVFAIPEEAEYRNIKKIGYATNFYEDDLKSVTTLIPLARQFNSEIIIAHVGKEKAPDSNGANRLADKIREKYNYENINAAFIEENDTVKGIRKLIDQEKLDVLAMAKRKRNFFEGLFHKSISKEITFSAPIPVIIYQSNHQKMEISLSEDEIKAAFKE